VEGVKDAVTVRRMIRGGWIVADGQALAAATSKDEAMRRFRTLTGDLPRVCSCPGCERQPAAFVGTGPLCSGHYVDALFALDAARLKPTYFAGDPARLLATRSAARA